MKIIIIIREKKKKREIKKTQIKKKVSSLSHEEDVALLIQSLAGFILQSESLAEPPVLKHVVPSAVTGAGRKTL